MPNASDTHEFRVRVYFEDTDLAGIVYYANYLKFIERARTEWIRALGVDQGNLHRERGLVFVVRRIEADYRYSTTFDDELIVTTRLSALTGARIDVVQEVIKDGRRAFSALVTLACLSQRGTPVRIPEDIRQHLLLGNAG